MPEPRHPVCVGTVVTRDDACLLVRQSPGASLAGQWSIPWGFVDDYETLDAAAERETLEESGVRVRLTGVVAVQMLPGDDGGIGIVFAGEPIGRDEPRADGTETDDARFLTAAEIDDLPVEPWCAQLALAVLGRELDVLMRTPNPYGLPGWAARARGQ